MPRKNMPPDFYEFTKDMHIVNFCKALSGEALARLIAEKRNPQVDALWGGPADTYEAGIPEGVFEQYSPKEADKIPAKFRSTENYWTGIGIIPLCFLSNNEYLKSKGLKVPTSWLDLTDPRYGQSLQMADVRTSGTATERIYSLIQVSVNEAYEYQKNFIRIFSLYQACRWGDAYCYGQASAGVFYIVMHLISSSRV